jgi:hypothetical protein
MPFGKHRGRAFSDLPSDYLEWLLGLDDLRPPLRRALEAEAERRGFEEERERDNRSAPRGGNVPALRVVEDVINAGRRALAARHHPDRGGGPMIMRDVNAAADWLLVEARRIAS